MKSEKNQKNLTVCMETNFGGNVKGKARKQPT